MRSRRAPRPNSTRRLRSCRIPPLPKNPPACLSNDPNALRRPTSILPWADACTGGGMSQAEDPILLSRERSREVSLEDVRRLMGASTPHFALQLRNRIAHLISDLPLGHPARLEGERE